MEKTFTSSGSRLGSIETHWGVPVELTKPTTGVVQNSLVPWLSEEVTNGVDISWEEHCLECGGQCMACDCNHRVHFQNEQHETFTCGCECDPHDYEPSDDHETCYAGYGEGDILIGDWKEVVVIGNSDPDLQAISVVIGEGSKIKTYSVDREGKEGYAAIAGEVYTQVLWSKTVRRVRSLCSPCFPGQADVPVPWDIIRAGDMVRYTADAVVIKSGLVPYAKPELNYKVIDVRFPGDARTTGNEVPEFDRDTACWEPKHVKVVFADCEDDTLGVWIPYDQLELVEGYLAYDLPVELYEA